MEILGKTYKTFRVFRGLALPRSAVEPYKLFKTSGKQFYFTAFTSTSVNESVARGFARKNAGNGKIPCLFVLEVKDDGYAKAYLHNEEYSAFPEEKEVLLGENGWRVEDVVEE